MHFFLDESGNTGGTSRNDLQSSFGGQRIFTLAAIGAPNEQSLIDTLLPLLERFNIQSKELKASMLYKKKTSIYRGGIFNN